MKLGFLANDTADQKVYTIKTIRILGGSQCGSLGGKHERTSGTVRQMDGSH